MKMISTRRSIFISGCIALVACAMTFAIRADMLGPLGMQFGLSSKELGWVAGTAFWGFTLAMIFGGAFLDYFGMAWILAIAFTCHLTGIVLTIFSTGFWSLFFSTLLVGLGNGLIESAFNPMIPTLYPEEKTKMLNKFHVWFPLGIVIGGLTAFALRKLDFNWRFQMASILLPVFVYGFLFLGKKFPKTERVTMGVSTKDMCLECLKRPLFWFMTFCVLLSASVELGTGQWIAELLGNIGVPAILLLVFINGIMGLGRYFAGPVVHKFSPAGVLLFSAIFSFAGLWWLSLANGYMAFAAATVFAIGVCYFWPTMYGFVSEYIPKSGALGLSIIGGAGMFSVSLVLPFMGQIYDWQTAKAIPVGYSLETIRNVAKGTPEALIWAHSKLIGGATTLQYVSVLPAILIICFTTLIIIQRRNKSFE
jgi:MFS family permease